MSGAIGCREALWSEKLDSKELRGALGGERDLEWICRLLNTVGMVNPFFSIYKSCGIVLISKRLCSLLHRCKTVSIVPHIASSFSHGLCFCA